MIDASTGATTSSAFDRLSEADRGKLADAEPGEILVLRFFCERLHEDWTILFQPSLGNLRPDILLMNPKRGIAVFEVKDWRLDRGERLRERPDGAPVLPFGDCAPNPLEQVLRYKYQLLQVHIYSLDDDRGRGAVTAGVVFPFARAEDVTRYMEPALRARPAFANHAGLYPICSAEDLAAKEALDRVFPGARWKAPKGMPPQAVAELRIALRESGFERARRERIQLTPPQKRLVETATTSGGRKLRGPAGSGKTVVLVNRALYLAAQGVDVLLVAYNVTLSSYLAELLHSFETGNETGIVEVVSFHRWAGDLLSSYGQRRMRAKIHANPDLTTDQKLQQLVERAASVSAHDPDGDRRWGAVLIDEAQDFEAPWIELLRSRLARGGHYMVAVDPVQDVYGRNRTWGGIPGRWNELRASHRLPPEIAQLGAQFVSRYMPHMQDHAPDPRQHVLPATGTVTRWHNVRRDQIPHMAARLAQTMVEDEERLELSPNDITVLVESNANARTVAEALRGAGLAVMTTAGRDSRESSRLKKRFRGHSPGVKVTTTYSFKGWETRALIACVGSFRRDEKAPLVYTALTRVKTHPQGSVLYVVNAAKELRPFGRDHFAPPLRNAAGQRLAEL